MQWKVLKLYSMVIPSVEIIQTESLSQTQKSSRRNDNVYLSRLLRLALIGSR